MPTFQYTARDERGKQITGTIGAPAVDAVADQLKRMGYLVTSAKPLPDGAMAHPQVVGFRQASDDEIALLTLQLSKMIQVGLPLLTALRTLETELSEGGLQHAMRDVASRVEAGSSFSEALRAHPRLFTPLLISMVHAGEVSGRLEEVLKRLSAWYRRQADLGSQLKTALTYPCVLAVTAGCVITFLVVGIIPKFMAIFLDAGVPLPLPTQLLFRLSELIRHHWLWLLLGMVGVGATLRMLAKTPDGRRWIDRQLLRIPLIGPLVLQTVLSRFTGTFGVLVGSGVPMLEALAIVQQTVGNVIIAEVVERMARSVSQGGALADSLKVSRIFPQLVTQMVTIGEGSGTLEFMLQQMAEYYDDRLRYGLKRATTLVEPAFLLIMGGLVAFVLASILLPLFRMVSIVR